ncbi:MAG: DUF3368 domain-containing protein [Nitrospinota bacterium]|nr:MAG: DUF3368 domain-containing protein [Nitrospinota bacterium]
MSIVSDSGPILSFARADHLDLLREVVRALIIPEAVYEDIVIQGAGKPGAGEVQQATWIRCERVQDRSLVNQLPSKLHLGEREALALAKERGCMLLIDEYEARKEALRQNIKHFGSLRVLKEAKDRGIIQEIKPVLDAFIASGTYISSSLYSAFLREVDEA